jgi:hypothetical protein
MNTPTSETSEFPAEADGAEEVEAHHKPEAEVGVVARGKDLTTAG